MKYGKTHFLLIALLSTGCNDVVSTDPDTHVLITQVDAPPPATTVCDPFGGPGTEITSGLHGRLKYLTSDQPRYETVSEYMTHGTDAEVDLFFSQIDVTTRPFDRGFVTQLGRTLKTQENDTLYEYFGIHFESRVKLSNADAEGRYQFAVLSDDGSIFEVREGEGPYSVLTSNDRVTPSRLTCASRTVSMDQTSRLPMRLDYFQGPRYHISLVMLWRHIPVGADDSALADPACELADNDLFFDSSQSPPAPTDTWQGMLDRGWKVLSPENFLLPEGMSVNPCQGGGGIGT